jgi:acetoin utilization deacetylase AcuC-like enzyme
VLIISSPRFEDHVTPPGHPERLERAHVFDAVALRWLQNGGRISSPRAATREELQRVHHAGYLDAIEQTSGRAVMLDPDTFTSPDTEAVARLAAGATVQAAEHAIATGQPSFALVRPPGHHAEPDRSMGFCLYNNVAVAAAAARGRGLERVAIVDIDVHHGNGTQRMFYEDASVLYVSTHQFPFYPGTGAADETGHGEGLGTTVNVPMEAGATDGDYILVHERIVLPVLEEFGPQLTLVSAGYDAHAHDPLASMRMTASGYARVLRGLTDVALRHGSVSCVTEGGYDLAALASCLEASFEAIEDASAALADPGAPGSGRRTDGSDGGAITTGRAERAIEAVLKAQKSFWRGL